jgi:hypothetical protein
MGCARGASASPPRDDFPRDTQEHAQHTRGPGGSGMHGATAGARDAGARVHRGRRVARVALRSCVVRNARVDATVRGRGPTPEQGAGGAKQRPRTPPQGRRRMRSRGPDASCRGRAPDRSARRGRPSARGPGPVPTPHRGRRRAYCPPSAGIAGAARRRVANVRRGRPSVAVRRGGRGLRPRGCARRRGGPRRAWGPRSGAPCARCGLRRRCGTGPWRRGPLPRPRGAARRGGTSDRRRWGRCPPPRPTRPPGPTAGRGPSSSRPRRRCETPAPPGCARRGPRGTAVVRRCGPSPRCRRGRR